MMISKHFYHVLSFVLVLSFSFSLAHFRDVTPLEEFGSKSSKFHYSAPFPSPASFKSPMTSSDYSSVAAAGSLSDSSDSKDSGSSKTSDSWSSSGASGSFTGYGFLSDSGSAKTSDSSTGSANSKGSSSSIISDYSSSSDASGSSSGFSNSKGSDSSSGFGLSGSFKGSGSLSGSVNSLGSDGLIASDSFTSSGNSAAPRATNLGSSVGTGSANVGSSDSGFSMGFDASNSKEVNIKTNLSGSFTKVFAFGDSYTDTGNAQLLGILKSFVGALLTRVFQGTNSNFKLGGRSSNGRLVVDFLCDSLNIPTLQPYKAISAKSSATNDDNSGVNFAVGGATSLSGDFFANHKIGHTLLWKGIPLGFQTQIEWFNNFARQRACKEKSEEECKIEMGKHLIWLGQMGVDDFARVIGSSISIRWLTDITIDHISKILTTVLDSGAKFFVVQGLPPVGCCPIAKLLTPKSDKDEMGCSSVINRAVMDHNELLQKTLEEFRGKHGSEIMISYADYFNAYKTIVGNLAGFGFSDGSQACCGVGGGLLNFNLRNLCGMAGTNACSNPDSHVHWDGIHLTEAMHKQITRLFLQEGFCKPSFSELINRHRSLHS